MIRDFSWGSIQLGTLAMNEGTFTSENIISTGYCKVHRYVVLKLLVVLEA